MNLQPNELEQKEKKYIDLKRKVTKEYFEELTIESLRLLNESDWIYSEFWGINSQVRKINNELFVSLGPDPNNLRSVKWMYAMTHGFFDVDFLRSKQKSQ